MSTLDPRLAQLSRLLTEPFPCPNCGEEGRLQVFYPTGHLIVVHPGAFTEDGRRWADTGCILSDEAIDALIPEERR